MRKLVLFMNVSLDGFVAGPNDDTSGFTNDFDAFPTSANDQASTLLFGRRTYDIMGQFWPTQQAQAMLPDVARYMNETPKIVATRTPFEADWKHTRVLSGDVVGAVRQLKGQSGGDILILGSNNLCVSLMDAGLIDEFQLVVNPVVLGAGTTLFAGLRKKVDLTLTHTRQFKSGATLLVYSPAG